MTVLITGSNGFIGKNLVARLNQMDGVEILTFERDDKKDSLEEKVYQADFIFHLAGVNRPQDPMEFYRGNTELTTRLTELASKSSKHPPIVMSSSIQAERDNDYGKSKLEAEKSLEAYAWSHDTVVYIYRLPNVFGKWSRPNYNTVIATWCYNISRGLPIRVDDENVHLNLVYIDDVIDHFLRHLDENGKKGTVRCEVSPLYVKTLGEIKTLLMEFRQSRENLIIPHVGRGFERALYATYLSFLPEDQFSYTLKGYRDERGTFYEFLKTLESGQFSVSTTAPGITRGNHFHHTKNEKFLVVKGKAAITLRRIDSDEIIEYEVSDKKMEVMEMIPGYTHAITNTGESELVLLIWANEVFDPKNPDTYFLKVVE